MEKYKICPVCQTKNSPAVLECIECGNDLMGVRIVDDSHDEKSRLSVTSTQTDEKNNEPVRICDCGQVNKASTRKCIRCGEDISDVIPMIRDGDDCARDNFSIKSIDGSVTLSLKCPSEHFIGRECELSEYLRSKSYVSRKHAKIVVAIDGVFIENISKANGTYVNNKKIDDNMSVKLTIGDEIGLGGLVKDGRRQELAAYFILEK